MVAQEDHRFATTRWSLVQAAGGDRDSVSEEESREALAELCRQYWFPVYAHVRRRESNPAEAEDLTQEFFARLIDNNDLKIADQSRGRFRSFLLTMLDNFVTNEWQKSQTKKRGGDVRHVSIDIDAAESRLQMDPSTSGTAESEFERRWALAMLEAVFEKLRTEQSNAERQHQFAALQQYLMSPESLPYAEVADTLKMSAAAIKVAVHRLRKRFGVLLRSEISQTVASTDQIDDEIRRLQVVLSTRD